MVDGTRSVYVYAINLFPVPYTVFYSFRKLSTGLAIAALMDW